MSNLFPKTLQSLSKTADIFKKFLYKAGHTDILKNLELQRIPSKDLASFSKGIRKNSMFPAGKIIEFSLKDPNYKENLEFTAFYKKKAVLKNMPQCGIAGIDVYTADEGVLQWIGTICPSNEMSMQGSLGFYMEKKMYKDFLLVLPSYACVENVFVNAKAERRSNYFKDDFSIAFYGSSITQGCASSRPSLNYVNRIALGLRCRTYNFGFSESAHGEKEIMRMIAEMGTDVIVMEYDHNSSVMELAENHLEAYKTLRKYNTDALIIFMSRFSGGISESMADTQKRVEIIRKTHEYAIDNGDEKTVFINGTQYLAPDRESFFADDRHPNDEGHKEIAGIVKNIITAGRIDRN